MKKTLFLAVTAVGALLLTAPTLTFADEAKTETSKKSHKNLDGSTTTETKMEKTSDTGDVPGARKVKKTKKVTKKVDTNGNTETKVETKTEPK